MPKIMTYASNPMFGDERDGSDYCWPVSEEDKILVDKPPPLMLEELKPWWENRFLT